MSKQKFMLCKKCNATIPKGINMCPACGAKVKKSFFKRLCSLIVIVLVIVIVANLLKDEEKEKSYSNKSDDWTYDTDFYVEKSDETTEKIQKDTSNDETEILIETETLVETEEETEAAIVAETVSENILVDGMRPEFKRAMDEYEAFFEEYCEFMTEYAESGNSIKMLAKYTKMMMQYEETMSAMEAWESEDMNDTELMYYLDVTMRIEQKLLSVALPEL